MSCEAVFKGLRFKSASKVAKTVTGCVDPRVGTYAQRACTDWAYTDFCPNFGHSTIQNLTILSWTNSISRERQVNKHELGDNNRLSNMLDDLILSKISPLIKFYIPHVIPQVPVPPLSYGGTLTATAAMKIISPKSF